VAGDCNDANPAINPDKPDDCSTPLDENCSGKANEGCVYASCKARLSANPGTASGQYTLDPDGTGPAASFITVCDMTTDGGGWTLIGVAANDGTRKWNALSVFTDASIFGSVAALTNNFKSAAYAAVAGKDLLVATVDYKVAFKDLIASKTMAAFVSGAWPASCSSTWLHGKPDFYENLTSAQADLFSFTLRGWDNNANCFPDGNENSAISLQTATCCWVPGIGNNPGGPGGGWTGHDLSLVKKANLVSETCNPNVWPCNPQGKVLPYASLCYDTSCKQSWAQMYIR
jgi:hypothetical protein